MSEFEYHQALSSFRFRRNLATGVARAKYYDIDSADEDVRNLHRAAIALAHERGVDIHDEGLTEPRRNAQGWQVAPTASDLRHNAEVTRRLLDKLREAGVDLQEALGTSYPLAGFVLDADCWHCRILDSEAVVACRWAE